MDSLQRLWFDYDRPFLASPTTGLKSGLFDVQNAGIWYVGFSVVRLLVGFTSLIRGRTVLNYVTLRQEIQGIGRTVTVIFEQILCGIK